MGERRHDHRGSALDGADVGMKARFSTRESSCPTARTAALVLLSALAVVMLIGCDKMDGTSTKPTRLSPPSWIIGTWTSAISNLTWRFTSDSAVHIGPGFAIDFEQLGAEGGSLSDSSAPLAAATNDAAKLLAGMVFQEQLQSLQEAYNADAISLAEYHARLVKLQDERDAKQYQAYRITVTIERVQSIYTFIRPNPDASEEIAYFISSQGVTTGAVIMERET